MVDISAAAPATGDTLSGVSGPGLHGLHSMWSAPVSHTLYSDTVYYTIVHYRRLPCPTVEWGAVKNLASF